MDSAAICLLKFFSDFEWVNYMGVFSEVDFFFFAQIEMNADWECFKLIERFVEK